MLNYKGILALVFLTFTCTSFTIKAQNTEIKPNYAYVHAPKMAFAFMPLPFGAIEAKGWMRDWMLLTKEGLVGQSEAFQKGWRDGMPEPFFCEQTAYWVDGMLQTGYALHDKELINKAKADIDGFLKNRNYVSSWSMAVYGRAIMAYYKGTGDPAILAAMTDLYKDADLSGFWEITKLFGNLKPVFGEGVTADIPSIVEHEPRNLVQVEAMLEAYSYGADSALVIKALEGLKKYDTRFINHFLGRARETEHNNNGCFLSMHGVTYNEFAKLWALAYLYNGNPDYLQTSVNAYKELDEQNMMPFGVNSSQENLMGVDATASSETCTVSDFINSNIALYRIIGDRSYGDKIERALFNAGAAAWSNDCKLHVYSQAPNKLTLHDKPILKDHFKFKSTHDPLCCTGNITRMIPNFVLHSWMATPDNGVAALMYAPSEVTVNVADNVSVKIEEITDYPFNGNITFTVNPKQTVMFPLYLRIPQWCTNPLIKVQGKTVKAVINDKGFLVIHRQWTANDKVLVYFPMQVNCVTDVTKSIGNRSSLDTTEVVTPNLPYAYIERGPLLYTLKINDKTTKYRYALIPEFKKYKASTFKMANRSPWANVPVTISLKAQPIEWSQCPKLETEAQQSTSKRELITLVPYGCSQGVRVTMFPYVNPEKDMIKLK